MIEKTFRAFLGILPPTHVQESIAQKIILPLKKDWTGVNWVATHQLHITLAFLGDITFEQATAVAQALKIAAQKRASFSVALNHLMAFPTVNSPRVIRVDVQPHEPFQPMIQEIHQCLIQNQIPAETRPFIPHITIGRIKQECSPPHHWEKRTFPSCSLAIGEIILFKSELTLKGPIHEKWATVPLLAHGPKR